jgi:hypothetical protein
MWKMVAASIYVDTKHFGFWKCTGHLSNHAALVGVFNARLVGLCGKLQPKKAANKPT